MWKRARSHMAAFVGMTWRGKWSNYNLNHDNNNNNNNSIAGRKDLKLRFWLVLVRIGKNLVNEERA